MGSAPVHHLGTIIMKFLLLIAAIASVRAEAEANPAFTYATGYLPYAYGAPLAYAHAPLVYTAAAGCQNEAGAVVPCAHGGVVPFGVVPAAVWCLRSRTCIWRLLRLWLSPRPLCLPWRLPQLPWWSCPLCRWPVERRGDVNKRSK